MTAKIASFPHSVIPLNLSDFNTYKGTSECSGYEGIKNLFSLLKTDVKAAYKEHGIYVPKLSERLKELRSYIIHFNAYWDEWSNSTFCHLSKFEVSLINLYRKRNDCEWVGIQLGISYDFTLSSLVKAIWRLRNSGAALFQKWKDFKHLDTNNPDEFLAIPLEGLHHTFPNRVYSLLQMFGKNMREVLNKITIKQLHTYRNFGKKAESELKTVLKRHQCLHLLK